VELYQLGGMKDPGENSNGAEIEIPGLSTRRDRHNTRGIQE
jgi:hypothetical protein